MQITYEVYNQNFQNPQKRVIEEGIKVDELISECSLISPIFVPHDYNKKIKRVSVLGITNFVSYMKGNELALTTLQNFPSIELQKSLIDQLVKGKVTCVAFHPENQENGDLKIYEETIQYAQAFNFPILLLSSDTTYADIIDIVFNLEIKNQRRKTDTIIKEINQELFYFLSNRSDLEKTLRTIGRMTNTSMLITDINMNPSFSSQYPNSSPLLELFNEDSFKQAIVREEVINHFLNGNRLHFFVKTGINTMNFFAEAIIKNKLINSILFVAGKNYSLINELITHTIAALSSQQNNSLEFEIKTVNKANHELFLSKEVEKAQVLFNKVGLNIEDKNNIILFNIPDLSQKSRENLVFASNLKLQIKKFVDSFLLNTDFSTWYNNFFLIYMNTNNYKDIKKFLNRLKQSLKNFFPALHCYIGVGSSKSLELYKPFREALFASKIGALEHTGLVLFDDLGFLQVLADLKHNEYLHRYYKKTLSPILELEDEKKEELLLTLESFLDNNLNFKQSADVLYVHPNTVRYRIQQIKDIFMDTNIFIDANKRFDLYFSVKIMKIYSSYKDIITDYD